MRRTYVIGKDGQIVYNEDSGNVTNKEAQMQNNVPILAVDKANIEPRLHTVVKDFTRGDHQVRDFDITFVVGEKETPVTIVRIKEDAARELYEALGDALNNRQR